MRDLDVVIVGPVAPPLGGIAAHVERLTDMLERDSLRVGVVDHFGNSGNPRVIATLRRNPLRYWWQMRRLRATVVHYHYARWSTLVAAGLARRSHPGTWIATVHGHDIERALNSRIPGVRRLARWALSRFDQLIAVSNAVAEVISQPGGPPVAIIPAYLPPSSGHAYREESPEKRPTALLSATGVATKACTDVYGLDIGGAILARACAQLPDLRCEIYISRKPTWRTRKRYLARALQPLREAAADDRVTVHLGATLPPAFRPGVVYLRPTRTDGDAVSVREALDRAVPVLASDVVKRPPGVTTLGLDDTQAWVDQIAHALSNSRAQRTPPRPSVIFADMMIALYRQVLGDVAKSKESTAAGGIAAPAAPAP